MRFTIYALLVLMPLFVTTYTYAVDDKQVESVSWSVEKSTISEILENKEALDILLKHVPEIDGQESQLSMAGNMTLKMIQGYSPEVFNDETLAKIDSDFKKLK